ncbi:MAG: fasciclin domain-containing protein [Planctomycetota bacterium]
MKLAMLSLAALMLLPIAAQADHHKEGEHAKAKKNIVETAIGAEGFGTLVAAVKAGGLVEVLSGKGPFTVLAPTDKAFEKLPKGTLETLLKPENKDQLVAILKYHVISGKVPASKVTQLDSADTLNGKISISSSDKGVMLNKTTKVVKTDIMTSNGIIHVIDSVLLPPAK